MRFTVAGLVLFGWMMARGEPSAEQRGVEVDSAARTADLCDRLRAVVLGGAACAFGDCRGDDGDDSGVIALMEIVFLRTQRLTVRLGLALVVGLGGVAVLMSHSLNLGGAPIDAKGAVAILIGALSWSAASVLTRVLALPSSKVMSAGAQMLAGGLMLAVAAGALGEFRGFDVGAVSRAARFSLAYLIVDGIDRRIYGLCLANTS